MPQPGCYPHHMPVPREAAGGSSSPEGTAFLSLWPLLAGETYDAMALRVADPTPRPDYSATWCPDMIALRAIRGSVYTLLRAFGFDPYAQKLEIWISPGDVEGLHISECTHLFGMELNNSHLIPYHRASIYDGHQFYSDHTRS